MTINLTRRVPFLPPGPWQYCRRHHPYSRRRTACLLVPTVFVRAGGPTDAITRLARRKRSRGRVGYTLLMINPSYVVNPTLYGKVPYEFGKDFDLVSLAALTTLVITVHPSVPAHTLQELVALIKANPGKYSYASPGTGTPGHLVGETFRLSLGLDLVHVPFNSAGLAVGSAVGGHKIGRAH